MIRTVFAYIASVLVTYVTAAVAQSQFILARQEALIGKSIPVSDRLAFTWSDLIGLAVPSALPLSYPMIIGVALLIAYPVAALVGRILKPLRAIRYPAAGAAALFSMLSLMDAAFGAMPISGASTFGGLLSQAAAGGVGGLLFQALHAQSER